MSDRLAVVPQYLLPKLALTRLAGGVASRRSGERTTKLIRWFVARYGVDMSEAAEPDIARYATFNEFFTRALKPGARPLASAAFVAADLRFDRARSYRPLLALKDSATSWSASL